MSRVLAVMLSLLAVWIGLVQPSAAAASPTELPVAYNYSGHDQSALVTHPASKRGPPAMYDRGTTSNAVDRWSDGSWASPSALTTGAIHDYDTALLARADSATGMTNEPAWSYNGALSSFQPWQVAAEGGAGAARALSAAERTTLDDALRADKLDHVFDPKHKFDPLVNQFGSREAAMEQIVRNVGGPLPGTGPFEVVRDIGGQTVVIRGSVVDGIPRIGTAFTP